MAPKKPTMLQRQRALRKQQQQTKQQSSKQLPPKGQTSANSRQARGQRTSTAKAQAANQQRVIARGMEGFVRRGQAMDKLDKAAKGTQGSGTRIAGAGGGLAKRQSSAVTNRQSGKPATTGGRVQPSTGGGASSNRVQPVRVRDLGTTKPNQMSGNTPRALPPGRTGGALTRTGSGGGSAALRAATKSGRGLLGKAAVPLAMAGEVSAMMDRDRRWNEYKERMGMNEKTAAQTGGSRRGAAAGTRTRPDSKPNKPTLSSTGVRVSDKANQRDYQAAPTGSQQYNDYRNQQIAAERERLKGVGNAPKPVARPSASRPSQSTPSRSTASGSGSQRSAAPQATKPAMPGRKFEEFNPGRGTSKSNNPLLDRDSGGMKLRDRMKQRETSQQSEAASKLSNKFGQDSGYQPQTKVDGSKYADKKPDMKKVNEYDRRKRRYYD